ncbi:MAG: RNA polymerase sigma factor RpoH [Proteobacteria bacterium]|nr:RNA polymerase sigma factor RpoH [Pseudomonadota bacterium]
MNTALQAMDISVPVGSLDAYIYRVTQMPMLTLEEEQDLAKKLLENNDLQAAKRLVMAHLRYVVRVARGYMGYGLPLGDLIQEGNIGLMKAVKRFDPKVGVRLVSFAVHWIKAEIHEFILRNWRIVKVATTKAQRKLFFNLKRFKNRLGWFTKEEVQAVADDLGVSTQEVLRMEQRLNAVDASYDLPTDAEDSDDVHSAPVEFLTDHAANPAMMLETESAALQGKDKLAFAMEKLDARSQDILQQRWLVEKKLTLHDLAAKYEISAERVRQLEQNAMLKLKKYMVE